MPNMNPTVADGRDAQTLLTWYDFLCPFCYVGQHRTAIPIAHGLRVVELPFQAHPDIPPGGIPAPPRSGPMYAMLEREAREAGLPLNWPPRLPDTRARLGCCRLDSAAPTACVPSIHKDLFAAHFVLGEDLEDATVIDRHASGAGVDLDALHAALADGSAAAGVDEAEATGREYGVRGTPAWLLARGLITGLLPAEEFESLADQAMRLSG